MRLPELPADLNLRQSSKREECGGVFLFGFGEVIAEVGEFVEGGALGVADVEAAGGDAGAEGVVEGEFGEAAEAEAGVEVVAGSGREFRGMDEGAGEVGGFDVAVGS